MTPRACFQLAAAALLACGGLAGPRAVAAQTLAERVAAAPDGILRFEFPVRADVCSDGRGQKTWRDRRGEWEGSCENGPGRVSLDVAGHRVTALRFYVGGRWRADAPPATPLGAVSGAEAADFLMDLARRGNDAIAKEAIFPAAIAGGGAVVWPRLLELARDPARSSDVRSAATFWLSQQAADAATRGLAAIARDDGDRRVRRAAVFALSQRPHDEGVPALLEIARTSRDPDLRRQAIFWLGQTHDPRALDLLRDLLAGT